MKKVRDISRGNRRRFGTPDLESTIPSSPLSRHHRYLPSSSSSLSSVLISIINTMGLQQRSNCIYLEYQPRRQQRREAKSGKGRADGCKWWWVLQEQTKTGVAERQQRLPNIPSGPPRPSFNSELSAPKKGFFFFFFALSFSADAADFVHLLIFFSLCPLWVSLVSYFSAGFDITISDFTRPQ
jgi:hypothetical protein